MFNSIKNYYNNQKKPYTKTFKEKFSFEKRKLEAANIKKKYPGKIPIICEKYLESDPDIHRTKYLVPDDLSTVNFIYVIRKRIKLLPEQSLYIFVNDKILNTSAYLADVYENNIDKDGFLYIKYTMENTFG